jgi:hypothetical protein
MMKTIFSSLLLGVFAIGLAAPSAKAQTNPTDSSLNQTRSPRQRP